MASAGARGTKRELDLEDLPPTLSVERAGRLLGLCRRSAYKAAANGELPTLKFGRRLVVPTPRLLELLGVDAAAAAKAAKTS